uniref:Uncharacterized protein n=1 Tax=Rhizochromulina marina TaxID=1034831 RepID=A0A7S2SA32_9STRA
MAAVRAVLKVSEQSATAVYTKVCGPLFRARVEDVLLRSAGDGNEQEDGEEGAEGQPMDLAGGAAPGPAIPPDASEILDEAARTLNIPDQVRSDISEEFYRQRLDTFTLGSRIYSATEQEELKALSAALRLDDASVATIHWNQCASMYRNAVLEAMGSTGVITQEYLAGLDKLADRLMLEDEAKSKIFNEAMQSQMRPLLDRVTTELERSVLSRQQYAAKTGQDQGDDMFAEAGGTLGLEGGANMMLEIVNLVDFFAGNKLFTLVPTEEEEKAAAAAAAAADVPEVAESAKAVEAAPVVEAPEPAAEAGGGQAAKKQSWGMSGSPSWAGGAPWDGSAASEQVTPYPPPAVAAPAPAPLPPVPVPESTASLLERNAIFSYQIDATGMAKSNILEDVYKQFVVQTFQEKASPAKQERIDLATLHLAGILGISRERKEEIRGEIGDVVYSQYVNNLLQQKGTVEPSDFQLLVNIQSMLKMDEEHCVELLYDLKIKHLAHTLDTVRRREELRAEDVLRVRAAADKLGLDLVDDVDISPDDRVRFFLAEAASGIESGKITDENKEEVGDIQESWAIATDVAQEKLDEFVQKTCSAATSGAVEAVMSANNRRAVAHLDKLLSYAQILPVEVDLDARTKERLIKIYSAAKADFDGTVRNDEDRKRIDVLVRLGLTSQAA